MKYFQAAVVRSVNENNKSSVGSKEIFFYPSNRYAENSLLKPWNTLSF